MYGQSKVPVALTGTWRCEYGSKDFGITKLAKTCGKGKLIFLVSYCNDISELTSCNESVLHTKSPASYKQSKLSLATSSLEMRMEVLHWHLQHTNQHHLVL